MPFVCDERRQKQIKSCGQAQAREAYADRLGVTRTAAESRKDKPLDQN